MFLSRTLIHLSLTSLVQGRNVHRVLDRVLQRFPRHATRPELVSASLLIDHERRRHVHLADVREAGVG